MSSSITSSVLMWFMCLNAEYFCVVFNKHCKLTCSFLYLQLWLMLEFCTPTVLCSLDKSGGLYPIKQNTGSTAVHVKQCYCTSTVQASTIGGLAHEQKLVIEMSREETEERNCSVVCLLHPETPLINNVMCWEMAGTAEPCWAWLVLLMGLISSPPLFPGAHKTPDGFGGSEWKPWGVIS